jgi:hypothetical protein
LRGAQRRGNLTPMMFIAVILSEQTCVGLPALSVAERSNRRRGGAGSLRGAQRRGNLNIVIPAKAGIQFRLAPKPASRAFKSVFFNPIPPASPAAYLASASGRGCPREVLFFNPKARRFIRRVNSARCSRTSPGNKSFRGKLSNKHGYGSTVIPAHSPRDVCSSPLISST